jgi:bifunctional non-homologous end joining protein LigD
MLCPAVPFQDASFEVALMKARETGLERYQAKRRFDASPEPRGRRGAAAGNAYVVQKHAARRLHYDLRLELEGVMLSWAVTRGPSLVPGDKRLAMHVEDHPIDYNAFEGTIPEGQYGAGTVMIWDRGSWFPEGDARKAYKKGHLDFRLEGEKLSGSWHLVRMRKREGERGDPWLLIKSDDEAARAKDAPDILEELPLSVTSGRDMDAIAAGKRAVKRSASPLRAAKFASKTRKAAVKKSAGTTAPKAAKNKESPPRKATKGARRALAVQETLKTMTPGASASSARAKKATARANNDAKSPRRAKAAPVPDFVAPCLARLSEAAPDSGAWVHEVKFDGYRMQARLADGEVRLRTRTGLDWTQRFQPIADALQQLAGHNALIDGEIVVEAADGVSSFSALQEELKSGSGERFVFYVFDLLHLDGRDLREMTLIERTRLLENLLRPLPSDGKVRLSAHFEIAGSQLLEHACRMRLEGIICKRRDAPYRSGRTGDWLKVKCSDRQEFVIAGFVPATNDRKAVGSLVLGYYENGTFTYAGRAGTGFTHAGGRALWKQLAPLTVAKVPFATMPADERRARRATWVAPRLVAEVEVRGWTHGGRVRHAAFKGLREDKDPTEVVREEAAMAATASPKKGSAARNVVSSARERPRPSAHLTNPNRVYWEDVELTKQGLADYYTQVWDWIAPHITGRVLSLVRCPEGAGKQCFFQKHASAGLDGKRLRLVSDEGDEVIAIDSLDGLLALVQAGVLEIHVRGSRIEHLGAADRIVFDLDPGPGVEWADIKRAARDVRARLQAMELESYLKTTGGKGLHVVVPIAPTPWDEVKAFARHLATAMAADEPDRYIAVATKKARSGRIFVDYLRNSREATAIAPYSTRARPGATVSVPITWSELGALSAPNRFTVGNLMQRLGRLKRDPWAGILQAKQPLPAIGK